MCLFSAPDTPKAAIPPAVKPIQETDTALPDSKDLVEPGEEAKTEYGSKSTPTPKQKQTSDSLRIPLNPGGTGNETGGVNP